MSTPWLVIALVFLAATLLVYAVYWLLALSRQEQRIVNRRIELSRNLNSPSIVLQALLQERGFSNAENPTLRALSDWLTQTGIRVQHGKLAIVYLILFLGTFVLMSVIFDLGFGSFTLALILPVAGMFGFWSLRRRRRIFAFAEQLPEAIDIITRGLRSGLPFTSGIGLVAREMPDPVGTEFGILGDEITFGLDLKSALENLLRRVGQEDLVFLAVSVGVQAQTGGNLAEILSRLSKLMRDRARMRLKVRALSSEGRASAFALTVFPFGLFVIMNVIAPTYYGAVRGNPTVVPAVIVGLSLLAVGNVVMYRMVNFKY